MAKQIPYVGKCFPTIDGFMAYLRTVKFVAWRPAYITMHHTGNPDLALWRSYGSRKTPISDEQWMSNLATYYATNLGWRSGPQFFITPSNYCVLSLPERPGVHAVSFNANSWGVECVGNFDRGKDVLTPDLLDKYAMGMAALHIAAGLQPDPYKFKRSGLHFHRDDPLTSKTCPGSSIAKPTMVKAVLDRMNLLVAGTPLPKEIQAPPLTKPVAKRQTGTVVNVPEGDTLNVRAGAGQQSPVVGTLKPGAAVEITGSAMNGKTKWFSIDLPGDADGWVSSLFIKAG